MTEKQKETLITQLCLSGNINIKSVKTNRENTIVCITYWDGTRHTIKQKTKGVKRTYEWI